MSARTTDAALPSPDLTGVSVLVLTSGHEVLDGRIYDREACGLHGLGAEVVVVGRCTRGTPGEVPVLPIAAASTRLGRFLWAPWRCLLAARGRRPDIVHFHDAEMLAVLPAARLFWRKARFVYDVHEDFGNLMMIRDWLPAPVKPLVRALTNACEKTLARLTHGIVAVTPPLAAKFRGRPSVVAYNYPTGAYFRQAANEARKPAEREYDLVHIGTLNRRRAAFLADVLKEFHRLRPGARSLVVGAEEEVVRSISASLPSGCQVQGKIPYERVPATLGNARVGLDVHPWLTPNLVPALAVKVCEYMAAGCAVVASAMPVLDEVMAGSELEPGSFARICGGEPAEYARAAVRLLEAIGEGADPGAALRRFAERRMSFDGEAVKLGRFFRELVGRE